MKYSNLLFGLAVLIIFNFFLLRSEVLEYFDYKLYDVTSKIIHKDSQTLKSSVVIVDVDEKSLEYLGQWPWSRIILAKLVSIINEANPSSISLDIIFPEDDKTSPKQMINFYKNYFSTQIKIEGLSKNYFDNDKIFAASLSVSKSILSVYLSNEDIKQSQCLIPKQALEIRDSSNIKYEAKNILCNIDKIQSSSTNVGFINSTQDKDGIFRRLPLFMKYKNNVIPSLAVASFMSLDKVVVDKNSVVIFDYSFKTGKDENVLLNFYDKNWYKKISAVDLLSGKVDKNILKGKFVFIGSSAIGLHDRYLISTGESIAGTIIHATLIDNIINKSLRYQPESMKNINFLLSIVVLIVLLFYMQRKKQIVLVSVFALSFLFYSIFSIFMLKNSIYISSAYFLVPLGIGFFMISTILVMINYQEQKRFFQEISKAHSSTIDSMALVVESRDTETGAHIQRTKEYIRCLGEYLYDNDIYKDVLTPEFRLLVYKASPLHDIGKVAIPDNILKKPAKLTKEEFDLMKEHPRIGKEVLENASKDHEDNEFLKIALRIAYSHHEKWDGSGYPNGLKGDNIPLEARMMALADVYDALISKRVYKKPISFEDSEQIVVDGSGTHFDPVLVDAFIELKDKFKEIAIRIT
jgi:adenylate cyclase